LLLSVEGSNLPRPLTIPTVKDPDKPKGLPIAATVSPTLRAEELPKGIGLRTISIGSESLRTAKSL
jgi:hypothetical protein